MVCEARPCRSDPLPPPPPPGHDDEEEDLARSCTVRETTRKRRREWEVRLDEASSPVFRMDEKITACKSEIKRLRSEISEFKRERARLKEDLGGEIDPIKERVFVLRQMEHLIDASGGERYVVPECDRCVALRDWLGRCFSGSPDTGSEDLDPEMREYVRSHFDPPVPCTLMVDFSTRYYCLGERDNPPLLEMEPGHSLRLESGRMWHSTGFASAPPYNLAIQEEDELGDIAEHMIKEEDVETDGDKEGVKRYCTVKIPSLLLVKKKDGKL